MINASAPFQGHLLRSMESLVRLFRDRGMADDRIREFLPPVHEAVATLLGAHALHPDALAQLLELSLAALGPAETPTA